MGLTWVSVDGPFNEHLIRDVGALSVTLTVLYGAAAWRLGRDLVMVAAIAGLCFSVPHLAYHVAHLDMLPGTEAAGEAISLALPVVAGVVVAFLAPGLADADPVNSR
jgi:hypothetical protein